MTEEINQPLPATYKDIDAATRDAGFTMASDQLTCSLLRTLAASKPGGTFLELGTGTGLSTSWILSGMDENSLLVSIDHDPAFLEIARSWIGEDKRLQLLLTGGEEWVNENKHRKFDFIFADTWHGKYLLLDEVLGMLSAGGLYIIDDMLPQPNWPAGHSEKVTELVKVLEERPDLVVTKQVWATGIIIAVKK